MTYQIFLLPKAQKDLDGFRGKLLERLTKTVLSLASQPKPHGVKKLTAEEGYRIRVGDIRILYRIDMAMKQVFVYRVKHRREVYR